MPTPPAPSDPKAAEAIPVPLDESLRRAWERHGNTIYVACALIVAAILARGGWDYVVAQREHDVRKEYAACTTPESLGAFAASHPGHPLAALARLQMADDAYAGGHYADSVAKYEEAAAQLPPGPFQARAKLGLAMAQALSGKTADAEAGLRQLLNDAGQLNAIRCEAGYQLAGLAAAAGRESEIQKLAEQLMQIDPSSPFSERVFALRTGATGPAPTAPPAPTIAMPPKR